MLKTNLVVTTAAAVALAGFTVQPVAAAPRAPAIVKQQGQDFSAARKKRRHYGRGFPLAAFGAIAGTIAGIAAAEHRREYYAAPYGYYPPGYVYDAPAGPPAYVYAQPTYVPPAYGYQHYGYHGGYHHFGGGAQNNVDAAIINPSPGH